MISWRIAQLTACLAILLNIRGTYAIAASEADALIVNDDGYDAPGLAALASAAVPFFRNVTVCSTSFDRSGTANATSATILDAKLKALASGYPVVVLDSGFPSDCILWALDVEHLQPNIILSGINQNLNTGPLACISGTVGAARTATFRGIPSVAFSQFVPLLGSTDDDLIRIMAESGERVRSLLPDILDGLLADEGEILSPNTLLSVNLPICTTAEGSIESSPRQYDCEALWTTNAAVANPVTIPSGITFGGIQTDVPTDIEAVQSNAIAITPLPADLLC